MTGIRRLAPLCALAFLALGVRQIGPGQTPIRPEPLVERPAVHPGATLRAALRVPIPPGLHIQSNDPGDPTVIAATLTPDPPPGIAVTEVVFPPSRDLLLPGYPGPTKVFEGTILIGVTIRVDADHAPGPVTLPARFGYQACNDTTCFRPMTVDTGWTFDVTPAGRSLPASTQPDVFGTIAFGHGQPPAAPASPAAPALPATPGEAATSPAASASPEDVLALWDTFEVRGVGGYAGTTDFLTFIHDAEAGVRPKGMLEGRGPLAILVLVFIGGLALNLTPCVLPMIPINLAIIGAGTQAGNRTRGFLLGSAYGAAMTAVYGVLGVIVILTAGSFGVLNASPWFNIAIAVLFVVLGLAMFDIVHIDFSRASSRIRFNQNSRGTFMLAFGMGGVAALLAGACVAPVVIQVVVFASDLYGKGNHAALLLPFVLGLGMALPWPLAGAGLSALPRPGAWMVRVKQVIGVFILITAAYYGYLAYEGFANRWVDPAQVTASADAQIKAGWHPSLVEGLETARREQRMVIVDFWASWCKNCLVMDKTTLVDPRVVSALAGYTKIKFQAEDLTASPARELMTRIGAYGLPAYVILRPR